MSRRRAIVEAVGATLMLLAAAVVFHFVPLLLNPAWFR